MPELRRLSGPLEAAHALDPPLWVEDRLGVTPDGWQAKALRSLRREALLLAARQSGKSTLVAWRIAHRLAFWRGSTSIAVSPTARQSAEIVRKVTALLDTCGVPLVVRNAYACETQHGSRFVAVPGGEDAAGARGYAVDGVLALDEACFVAEDVIAAIRPMVSVARGVLFAISSAGPASSWFAGYWRETERDPHVLRLSRTAYDNPRLDRAFLDRERRALGEARFRAEYLNEFSTPGSGWFAPDAVEALFATVAPPPAPAPPPPSSPALHATELRRLFDP